jgi:hypothetical protein
MSQRCETGSENLQCQRLALSSGKFRELEFNIEACQCDCLLALFLQGR